MAAGARRRHSGPRSLRSPTESASAYSKLVLATGSQAIRLPQPGADLHGVHTFRDCADVEALPRLARAEGSVIGGGLLGLEAAYGLAKSGVDVTLVHLMDRLMERQLDAPGAALLKQPSRPKACVCCSTPTRSR